MRICMAGACGRMGRRILEFAEQADDIEIGGAFDHPGLAGTELLLGSGRKVTVSGEASPEIERSDVLIDFTLAEACLANVEAAANLKKPAVVGTTGLTAAQKEALAHLAGRVPIVFAPNMSIGVNLLFKLTSEVAKVLGLDYNVEVVEAHHNQKKDSPSGTAVRLAECAAEALGLRYDEDVIHGREGLIGARPKRQVGMHALRGGDITGDHTVYFIGAGERIELTHRAHSRDTFAQGALRAARFVAAAGCGLYDMQDVLGLR